MDTPAPKTIAEIAAYIVQNGYHVQCNEDGSIDFNGIDADLYMDEGDGKVVLPDHVAVEMTYEFMNFAPIFTSPAAATLYYAENG